VALLAFAAASAVGQQASRSPYGTLVQMVGATRVELVYRRPVARGRELFGALVPWGRVWTPSADSAARITFAGPVHVNGMPLAAGMYGLWTIPDSTSWTVIFSGAAETHHLRYAQLRSGATMVPMTIRAR
jgi:hypothetical protein